MRGLAEFAREAGVIVKPCGPGWGGRYGFTSADTPNCTWAGYKTVREAHEAWAAETFGERASAALLRLLGEKGAAP